MAGDSGERLELLWRGNDLAGEPANRAGSPRGVRGGRLPDAFGDRYEGGLAIALRADRPTVVSNFVTTLDGVVAMRTDGSSGGGDVSGRSDPDRFLMGLLRTLADVVLVGGGTFTADPHHEWTPRRVYPANSSAAGEWRAALGLAPQPTTIVVSGSGRLDPRHPGLNAVDVPAIVVTTEPGAAELGRRGLPETIRIEVEPAGPRVAAQTVLDVAASAGAGLVVCEGGPRLFGDLLAAGLVDEMFQTVAPHVAGRAEGTPRRSLVEGVSLGDRSGLWTRLASVHRSSSHLFLRFALPA